jgi:quercetin dioxygenase-like cupin family protein
MSDLYHQAILSQVYVCVTQKHTMMQHKQFKIDAGKSRFDEQTKLFGVNPNDIKISTEDTEGKLSVLEYTGNVKGGPPLHFHNNQDEIFYILEGKYTFQVGEEKYMMTAGDTIFLPRQIPHSFAQISEKGKMLFFFHPSGKIEDYFRKTGSLKSMPTPEEGAKIFEDHDMKVVGPPIAF